MTALNKAKSIAALAHSGQFRRDGITPYIEHSKAVAARVEGDPIAEMVAWLHDVIEDTSETPETLIAQGISVQVVEAVSLMTHSPKEPYNKYLERIKSNPLAKKVKIADMLTNLSDTPTERQIKKYAEGLLFLLD